MKAGLMLVALGALAVMWGWQKAAAVRLAADLAARQAEHREFLAAERENARLRAQLPNEEEVTRLRQAGVERARLRQALEKDQAADAKQPARLSLGEWRPAASWTNRGDLTPLAVIETTLWAAAGGDVAALTRLLSLRGAAREQAEVLLGRLPEATRRLYAQPEDLVAACTIKNIPVGAAQLVWFNQTGPDDATACVFLRNPAVDGAGRVDNPSPPAAESREQARAEARERHAPQSRETGQASETYLTLHREETGWRIVVPPIAVDQITKELTAGGG